MNEMVMPMVLDGEWKELLWEFEPVICIIGVVMTAFFFWNWYKCIFNVWPKNRRKMITAFLFVQPFIMLLIIFFFISQYGTEDVRTSIYYTLLYTSVGICFISIHNRVFSRLIDISPFTDALHRHNIASTFPICGGLFASAVTYSCMNMGDGDGWWCVFVPYLLCWGFWLVLARIYVSITDISEKITVGRDIGTGIRSGGYFAVSGFMIAVMNIGDYVTFGQILRDFVYCLPVLMLFAAAVAVEVICKSYSPQKYHEKVFSVILSCLTVCVYILLACIFIKFFTPTIVQRFFT